MHSQNSLDVGLGGASLFCKICSASEILPESLMVSQEANPAQLAIKAYINQFLTICCFPIYGRVITYNHTIY
jgi:uncharacterized protein with PQ loop repeat